MKRSVIAVVSGGMDSTTMLHYIVKRSQATVALALTFDYGQTLAREMECAKYQCGVLGIGHQIVDLKPLARTLFSGSALVGDAAVPDLEAVLGDPQPITYVPNRNTLFVEIATAVAETIGAESVYIGIQRHDVYGYWDTTPQWLNKLNALHALNRKNHVLVQAPFANWSKAKELEVGVQMGVDYAHTWSCYRGEELACGQCATCVERLTAFKSLGLHDPLPYAADLPPHEE